MTLPYDPHYKFMVAAKAALEDSRSEIGLTWKIQKLAAMRGKKWEAGAYLIPMAGMDSPGYENASDLITVRTLAAIVSPSELKVAANMEAEMQLMFRVESIFRKASVRNAPASVQALNSLTPDPLWRYQITSIEPSDRFLAQAFGAGYDASATVLATQFTIARSNLDFTALGGP